MIPTYNNNGSNNVLICKKIIINKSQSKQGFPFHNVLSQVNVAI